MALERLIITCGGTGGHFYPGLAIACTFQQQCGKVLLLLSGVNAEKQSAIAKSRGIEAVSLPLMPQPKKNPVKFLSGLFKGTKQSLKLVREFSPQAMLGMGSFASVPAILSAVLLKVPVFLHDGNARVGRANRYFSWIAKFLATAYDAVNAKAAKCTLYTTGMPLRSDLIEKSKLSKSDAIAELNNCFNCNLDASLDTVLIFGGSQGAAVINENFPAALKQLEDKKLQVLHLCGKGKLAFPQNIYREVSFPYLLLESSEKMDLFLAAADLAVCRSGGSSLAELALYGVPAILIPFPLAAEGHQTDNAKIFAEKDAAVLVPDAEIDAAKAKDLLTSFFEQKDIWNKRAENMAILARPQATEDLLSLINQALQ